MDNKSHTTDELIYNFIKSYGRNPDPQAAETSIKDQQLKSLSITLKHFSDDNDLNECCIVDIGCGYGPILNKLIEIGYFANKLHSYIATDELLYKNPIFQLAIDNNCHKQVDYYELEEFYKNAVDNSIAVLYIVRNVLHELSIEQTAQLILLLCNIFKKGDLLILQDLSVFPKAERGNACWDESLLKSLWSYLGFKCTSVAEISSKGNKWFSQVIAYDNVGEVEYGQIRKKIVELRLKQWKSWDSLSCTQSSNPRLPEIVAIDFDFQYAALTQQLSKYIEIKCLDEVQESRVLVNTFNKYIKEYNINEINDGFLKPDLLPHFKDRARNFDSLETFFRSESTTTYLFGPPLMGKTALVEHFLATVNHGRIPIFIDILNSYGVWNIIETILSGIRCLVKTDIIIKLKTITYSSIRGILIDFLKTMANKIVITYDHFERIIDDEGFIFDKEIQLLLNDLIMLPGVKIIITSRFKPSFRSEENIYSLVHPIVARFPKDIRNVTNVLNSIAGIDEYNEELLEAIDWHPLLAVLAATYIRNKGKKVIEDEEFLYKLKHNLRNALFANIIDEEAIPAINVLSRIRIPIPKDMVIELSSEKSIAKAEENGVIKRIYNFSRDDLVSCLGTLKHSGINEDEDEDDNENSDGLDQKDASVDLHTRIAKSYKTLYEINKDPKWLRECHYHSLLSGDKEKLQEFGVAFRSEFFFIGEYWFVKMRQYENAFWAYNTAKKYGDNSLKTKMRLASCKIRLTIKYREGINEYEELLNKYNSKYVLSSFVDALLAVKEYDFAYKKLEEHKMRESEHYWTVGQYGRIYLGTRRYTKALDTFKKQLRLHDDPVIYSNLSIAYHKIGDSRNEENIIKRGLRRYPSNRSLNIKYGSVLERTSRDYEKTLTYLQKIREKYPLNGWVILPLIKTLCKLKKDEDISRIYREINIVYPEYVRNVIKTEYHIYHKNYKEAIRVNRSINQRDENTDGQLMEIYFSWAINEKNETKRKEIAEKALSNYSRYDNLEFIMLISILKMAIIARNEDSFSKAKSVLLKINNDFSKSEIRRLLRENNLDWDF